MSVLARGASHHEPAGRNADHLRTVLAFLELAVGTVLRERRRRGEGREDKAQNRQEG